MRPSESTLPEEQLPGPEIDQSVKDAIGYVSQYMEGNDDWVDIKIEIMNTVRPELRRKFSRRDQATREQVPNDFDVAVICEYTRVSGVTPVVRTLAARKALRSGASDE